jgi:uncharacterized membrane protein YdbT with pleckstrin-like domain
MISTKRLPDRRPDEKIILHLRRHWFIFFKLFFGYIILSLLPVFVFYYFYFAHGINLCDYAGNEAVRAFFLVAVMIYYMAIMVFCFTLWTEIYLDVWTLTTERVICRNQKGLFNRVVSELELAKIQDVTVEQKGLVATFLGYGYIYIQTAGEVERFVFEQVPHPYKTAKMIQTLDEQIKCRHNQNTPV